MTKTEQSLIDAIESRNYDEALSAFEKYQELSSSSDEQSGIYFDQIEKIKESETATEEVAEESGNTGEAEIAPEVIAPRIEKRGKKPKEMKRAAIESKFLDLLEASINYNDQVKKSGNADAIFARRLVQKLSLIKKQIVR